MSRQSLCRLRYILSDLLAVWSGTMCYNVIRYLIEDQSRTFGELSAYLLDAKMFWVTGAVIAFWMAFFTLSGYYNKVLGKSRIDEFFLTVGTLFVGVVVEYLFLVVDDVIDGRAEHLWLFVLLYIVLFVPVYGGRLLITLREIVRDRKPEYWVQALLIGSPEVIRKLESVREEMHFHTSGRLSFADGEVTLRQVADYVAGSSTGEIYVLANEQDAYRATSLLYDLYSLKLPIKIYIEGIGGVRSSLHARTLRGMPLYDVTKTRMSEMAKNVKWLFDHTVSLVLLLLLLPLYAVLALLVKRSSPGPIIYSQERIGLRGCPFKIYKFRTMYVDAEAHGPALSQDGDKRVTPIGRFLRKYRLDELPQFYNVLRGDMSFVGPRPERAYYINQLIHKAPYYYLLHQVRPGITSWGMVRYGYASNVDEMLERLYYDWLYYEHMSIKLDLTVLLFTIGTIVKGKGK